mmetsp:Transcript_2069/g.7377  ORF Transcript_2069/g.7377 Transcript_2069/m.7377 type:complete len:271 (-) Transcript_2069:836-1648(-)
MGLLAPPAQRPRGRVDLFPILIHRVHYYGAANRPVHGCGGRLALPPLVLEALVVRFEECSEEVSHQWHTPHRHHGPVPSFPESHGLGRLVGGRAQPLPGGSKPPSRAHHPLRRRRRGPRTSLRECLRMVEIRRVIARRLVGPAPARGRGPRSEGGIERVLVPPQLHKDVELVIRHPFLQANDIKLNALARVRLRLQLPLKRMAPERLRLEREVVPRARLPRPHPVSCAEEEALGVLTRPLLPRLVTVENAPAQIEHAPVMPARIVGRLRF